MLDKTCTSVLKQSAQHSEMISVVWKLYTQESTFNSFRSEYTGFVITHISEFMYSVLNRIPLFCFDFVFKL